MPDKELLLVTAALVQLLKTVLNVDGKWVVLSSVVVGSGLAALQQFAPEVYAQALPIIITGLVASGLYDLAVGAGRGALSRLR